MSHAPHPAPADDRALPLAALSSDQPERLVRFLTGAVLASGGWILTRSTQGDHAAELEFEFPRASCVEIYAVLVAAGLELSRDSHLRLAHLCHCTRNLGASDRSLINGAPIPRARTIRPHIIRIDLTVQHATPISRPAGYSHPLAA